MADVQTSLFAGPALARRDDPITSQRAAREIESSGKADIQRRKVLTAVQSFPGKTSAELAPLAGLDRYACARRLPELERSGLVRRGEARICQAHGTAAMTWWPA